MSTNTPLHAWTAHEPHRPLQIISRLMLVALVISVLLLLLVFGRPALNRPAPLTAIPQAQTFNGSSNLTLDTACSPFAALHDCLTMTADSPAA